MAVKLPTKKQSKKIESAKEFDRKSKVRKKIPMPKTLGACIDLLYTKQQERIALHKQSEKIKSEMAQINDHLLTEFPKQDLKGGKGKIASVSIKPKDVGVFEDFDLFWKYVKKNDLPEFFQKRLNQEAVKERWAANKNVPGVGVYSYIKVTPHKLGAKDRGE